MTVEARALQFWRRMPLRVRSAPAVRAPLALALRVVGRGQSNPWRRTPPRVVRTLPELDEMLAQLDEAAKVSDDELRRGFTTFVMDLDLDLPRDPYSDAYRDRVFDLFEKLDPRGPGSGVGLAVVKRVVESHGGRVWLESEGPGAGTTACVLLPLAEPAVETRALTSIPSRSVRPRRHFFLPFLRPLDAEFLTA